MSQQWYHHGRGGTVGPLTPPQLQQMAQDGELAPTDLLYLEGTTQWVVASSLRGLFGVRSAMPPLPQQEHVALPGPWLIYVAIAAGGAMLLGGGLVVLVALAVMTMSSPEKTLIGKWEERKNIGRVDVTFRMEFRRDGTFVMSDDLVYRDGKAGTWKSERAGRDALVVVLRYDDQRTQAPLRWTITFHGRNELSVARGTGGSGRYVRKQ